MVGLVILLGFLAMGGPQQPDESPNILSHNELECSRCHALTASLESNGAGFSSAAEQCRTCHGPAGPEEESLEAAFHYSDSRACTDCHRFHETDVISAAGVEFKFDYSAAPLREHCRSCHDQSQSILELTVGHREASAVYHRDSRYFAGVSPSDACLYCHSTEAGTAPDIELSQNPPRFEPSAGHMIGTGMTTAKSPGGFSEKLPEDSFVHLIEGRIECQSCHSLTADTGHLLAGTGQEEDVCLACHVRNIG